MTWVVLFNFGANSLILGGLIALALACRRFGDAGQTPRMQKALKVSYWSFLTGATGEIAVSVLLFLRSLDPAGSDLEQWLSGQYLIAVFVGILVWFSLRRHNPWRVVAVADREMSADSGSTARTQ